MKDVKKIFGNNLKRYRLLANLSQEKLAEECGLHRTYISSVERGNRNISIENIYKISLALNIDSYLLLDEL